MRHVLLAAVLVAGCGKAKEDGTAPPARGDEKTAEKVAEKPAAKEKKAEAAAPETVPLDAIAAAYQSDANTGDAKYKGKRLRVSATVRYVGDGWVSSCAVLKPPQWKTTTLKKGINQAYESALAGFPKNVVFLGATGAKEDKEHVIEGVCDGLTADPKIGPKLTFSDCKLVK